MLEDKEYLYEQLEALIGVKPLFYLKFCRQETYAKDICKGNLYMNTAKFFRELEKTSGERGQGDIVELILPIKAEKIMAFDENGNVFFTALNQEVNVQIIEDDEVPIVSFVGIPLREMKMVYADETHADFIFPFTDTEYANMKELFGEYCVIINGSEIESKLIDNSKSNDIEYIFEKIEYCKQNRIDRFQAFNKCSWRRFLYKNDDLKYQREYRLAMDMEIPKDHFLKIGDFKDAKIIDASKLSEIKFRIDYLSRKK